MLGGGEADSWNRRTAQTLAEALPGSHLPSFVEAARASLAGLRGINPTDPTEGMLASQIVARHLLEFTETGAFFGPSSAPIWDLGGTRA